MFRLLKQSRWIQQQPNQWALAWKMDETKKCLDRLGAAERNRIRLVAAVKQDRGEQLEY